MPNKYNVKIVTILEPFLLKFNNKYHECKNLELLAMNNNDKKNCLPKFFGLKLKNKNK